MRQYPRSLFRSRRFLSPILLAGSLALAASLSPGRAGAQSGPEVALDAPVPGTGAGDVLAVARGHGQSLVVWHDRRSGRGQLYGARVAEDGAVLDPHGILLLDSVWEPNFVDDHAVVASDGASYLVVAHQADGLRGLRAVRVSQSGDVLDPDGIVLAPRDPEGFVERPAVAFNGTDYLVAWQQWPLTSTGSLLRYARVTPGGAVLDPDGIIRLPVGVVYTSPSGGAPFAVASDGQGFLLAWLTWDNLPSQQAQIWGARLDAQGALLDPAGFPVSPVLSGGSRAPGMRAAFDGTQYVVAWSSAAGLGAARVTTQGTVLDPLGISIAAEVRERDIERFDVARAGSNTLFVWEGSFLDELGTRYRPPQIAALSPDGSVGAPRELPLEPGSRPTLGGGGAGATLAWNPHTTLPGFRDPRWIAGVHLSDAGAPLDTPGFALSAQANSQQAQDIAFSGQEYLVVWAEPEAALSGRKGLFAVRVGLLGDVLDPVAIPIAAADATDVHAVFDGESFVIVWTVNTVEREVQYAARVSRAGTVLDAAPIEVPACTEDEADLQSVASSDGERTLLVTRYSPYTGSSGDDLDNNCFTVIDRQGTVVRQPSGLAGVLGPHRGYGGPIAMSFGGSHHLVAWIDFSGIEFTSTVRGMRFDGYGAPLDPEPLTLAAARSGHVPSLAMGFDGTNHLLVWNLWHEQDAGLYGLRVGPDGNALDAEPFPIATGEMFTASAQTSQPDCHNVRGYTQGACPAVVFDGEKYVVAWRAWTDPMDQASVDLYGAEVSPEGEVLSSLVLSGEPETEGTPALASAGDGSVMLAYSRFVPEPPISARRAFIRRLGPSDSGSGGEGGLGGSGGEGGLSGEGGLGGQGGVDPSGGEGGLGGQGSVDPSGGAGGSGGEGGGDGSGGEGGLSGAGGSGGVGGPSGDVGGSGGVGGLSGDAGGSGGVGGPSGDAGGPSGEGGLSDVGGSGGSGGGGESTAGGGTSGTPIPGGGGCSCSVVDARSQPRNGVASLLLLGALSLLRRRRPLPTRSSRSIDPATVS